MPRIEHAPGCVLDPVHWLRHSIATAGRLVSPHEDEVRHGPTVQPDRLMSRDSTNSSAQPAPRTPRGSQNHRHILNGDQRRPTHDVALAAGATPAE